MPFSKLGFHAYQPLVNPATISFLQATDANGATTTTTFSAVNFGAADPNRFIVVAFALFNFSQTAKASTITIGGVAATIVGQNAINLANDTFIGFAYAKVPTGTSGNVVIVQGDFQNHQIIGTYRVISPSGALSVVDTGNTKLGSPITQTITTGAGGVAMMVGATMGSTAGTWALSGMTTNNDHTLGSASTGSHYITGSIDALNAGTLTFSDTINIAHFVSWLSVTP